MKRIYMDNAATTEMSSAAINAVTEAWKVYGNPSSLHGAGREAFFMLDKAREDVANALGANKNEIYFTSGGSESDNWAIIGAAKAMAKKGKKEIISTAIEHHAVLHTLNALEKEGFTVKLLPVSADGYVTAKQVEEAITENTALVTVMMANNEIGTIQPIAEIGEVCRSKGVLFHTDAVQAVGHIPVDVKALNVDMLSLSGHKFHGPKGVGALYVRKGIRLPNLINGGAQESGRRAGTENLAGICGMAAALKEATENMEANNAKIIPLRDKLINGLTAVERTRLNGGRENRVPNNVSVCFEGIEGESLLLWLDAKGICASSGSACTSGSLDPSHVLLAIGLIHEIAHGSLRLSLSEHTTEEEVDYVLETVPGIVKYLREMSPVWEKIVKEEK
ncbi:MAG: cysteine desulfurase NifS [Ruminococcaceae bacterium]|nr:cysteine desulfurase NifS [Oscillospiraceae bacterium]